MSQKKTRDKRRENQEREDLKARMASGIRLRLVHPSAARTLSSPSPLLPPISFLLLCVSALNSHSRLAPSSPPRIIKSPRHSYFSKPDRKGQCPARCRRPNLKGFQK